MPGAKKSLSSFVPNEEALMMIMSMGFTREQGTKALKATVSTAHLVTVITLKLEATVK